MKEIGTVISTFEGPSTYQFNFVIKEDTGKIPVHKGQFIQLKTEQGILVGRVDDVIKTNRYFMQAESVREYEKSGKPLMEMFPVDRWEYLVAKATSLGVYNNGTMKRVTYPPSPGSPVEKIDEKILSDFLGLDPNGLNIGKVAFHDLDAKINLTRLFHKHLAILAISGAGKSYLVSILLEELLNRPDDLGKPAIIVIDPHGEYVGFAEDENYSRRTKVFNKESPLSISASSLSPYQLMEFLPEISHVQRRELMKIIQDLKKKKKYYGFKELIKAIEDSEIKKVTKDTMISWISNLNMTHLFSNVSYPSITDLAKPGQLSIIDLSEFMRLNEKQIIVAYFARKLFNARHQGKIPPFILVVEEAHQFCLSEDTEILTANGWKRYNQVKKGDLVLSYNKEKDRLEISPVERIIVKEHCGNLIRLYNQNSIDSLVTEDHRVLCNIRTTGENRKWKWSEPGFVLAKDLPSGSRIPVASELTTSSSLDIDDDLLRILGWIITDGNIHFFDNKKYFSYEISQSKSKGKILEQMKDVIKRRFPKSTVHSRKRRGRFYDPKYTFKTEEFVFYLGKEASTEIKKWLGDNPHRIPRQLMEKASLNQLRILFDALVQGDGNVQYSKNGHKYIQFYAGNNSGLADDLQELCVRIGLSAIKKIATNGQIRVLISFKRKFAYVKKITKKHFSGKVWDITVKNGAFVARRNGRVFITGNCPEGIQRQNAISKGIIETIAREGRKFHASLVLVSQRPIRLSTTALSQCNTQILLRILNPYDLKHISESSEAITSDLIKTLPSLEVGEAIITGNAVNHPLFVQIRSRKSKESSKLGINFEDAIISYNDKTNKNEKDLDTFM